MAATLGPHQSTRLEVLQIECGKVELLGQLGIRGEQHLEPAVEQEAIDMVGAHAPADTV